ncbi:oxidoreductase [Lederbergia wuyishanensis]|uniref:Short-subunit dehydrogenase n=1 Tax=Lederbergia wuyishanensis TaxID=1347903 RepID=A0ABU0D0J7_9BACI|nr:oxidoreductase [Lederbergia wuyishanensis]MCJ8006540.1 oxidoreductase [Lederbergia wuyishanensis]MDQ0341919.1 short-subunit dehydrogenase [Lederbergia wuyishanensis]
MHKTAIITGASSGFGLLATIELAKNGFNVIATMRNLKSKDTIIELCKQNNIQSKVSFMQLDVTAKESIEELSSQLSNLPSIDILINNAGFAFGGFCEEVSILEYKEQFNTNLFGLIAVTQAVLPYMRKQKGGKVINMSSISGKIGFPGLSPYVASKHALEGWSECLRLEVKPFGIDVAIIEPGSFQTNIWTKGKKIAQKSTFPSSPYASYMKSIEKELESGKSSYGDPTEVAKLIVELCSKKELTKLRYPIGKGVKLTLFLKNFIPWKVWERIFHKRLNV